MAKEVTRPKIIDRLIAAYIRKTKANAEFEALKKQAKSILEKRSFDEVKISSSSHSLPDPEICTKWLKRQLREGNISRELFRSFFVMAFDQGKFIEAVSSGKIKRKQLPKGAYFKRTSERVLFTVKGVTDNDD